MAQVTQLRLTQRRPRQQWCSTSKWDHQLLNIQTQLDMASEWLRFVRRSMYYNKIQCLFSRTFSTISISICCCLHHPHFFCPVSLASHFSLVKSSRCGNSIYPPKVTPPTKKRMVKISHVICMFWGLANWQWLVESCWIPVMLFGLSHIQYHLRLVSRNSHPNIRHGIIPQFWLLRDSQFYIHPSTIS